MNSTINRIRSPLKISNSLNIEDNIHYKRIRKLKPFNLTNKNTKNTKNKNKNKNNLDIIDISNSTSYTIIQSCTETESIFVFQNIQKSRSSVFLFENEDDAMTFATLLEAETSGLLPESQGRNPKCLEVIGDDIVKLCAENGFNCYFHPHGSLVTPMNMDV